MGVAFWRELVEFVGWCRLRFVRRRGELAAGGNDNAFDRLDPFATVVEAGAGIDGAKNCVWAGPCLVNIFDKEFGGEAEILAAALVEASGARVAIDGAVIGESVLFANQFGVAPIDEILFEVGAPGVVADGAFALVAVHGGDGGMFVAVWASGFRDEAVERFGHVLGGVSGRSGFGIPDGFGLGCGFALRLAGAPRDYFGEWACGRNGVRFDRSICGRFRFQFRLRFWLGLRLFLRLRLWLSERCYGGWRWDRCGG
jgi:hypothetical protein